MGTYSTVGTLYAAVDLQWAICILQHKFLWKKHCVLDTRPIGQAVASKPGTLRP